jgi:glycosyltransferase involved in cell wall biosynthesis
MRILFLDQFNALGGAQRCLLDLIDAFPQRDVFAALPGSGPFSEELSKRGVPVHELPEMNYANGHKTLWDALRFAFGAARLTATIDQIAAERDVDLLYVNGPRLLPAAAAVPRPLVFHAHSRVDKPYASVLVRRGLKRSGARVIGCCDYVASALKPYPARVIFNGVRELPFRPPCGQRAWRIAIVGRIAPEKGQLDFARAARMLSERGVHADYVVFGEPLFASASYASRVRKIGSGVPVRFAGWRDAASEIYNGVDIVAVPSSSVEATPRVIMEAFAAGAVVVAYPSGGIPELVEDGVTGVLTSQPRPEALAYAIAKLLGDPRRMISIALAARQAWETRFSLQRYVREVVEFIGVEGRGTPCAPLEHRSAAT